MRGKFKSGKVTTMCRTREIDGVQVREECASQDQMNEAAMTENEARFSRTLQGAFMQPELRAMYGNLGNLEPATTQTLKGTIDIPSTLDFYAKLMIQAMKIPEGVLMLATKDMAWTKEEFKQSWGKQNTQTSCDSSQLPVNMMLHTIPFEMGFAPTPWEPMTDFELLKKLGVFDVELMRTIELMAAQYNMNIKRLGCMAMRHTEKYNLLPKEQCRSRKQHKSITCLMNKVFICNISRQLCLPLALTSNDVVKCYDYMIHNATSLSIQAVGIPHQPITAMFAVLQNAKHHVLTAFGKSKQSHGSQKRQLKNELPLMGVGQGNGAGPAAYAFLSAILIKVLASLGYGVMFTTTLSLITFNTVCSMFVDDCHLWQSATDVCWKRRNITEAVSVRVSPCVQRVPGPIQAVALSVISEIHFNY